MFKTLPSLLLPPSSRCFVHRAPPSTYSLAALSPPRMSAVPRRVALIAAPLAVAAMASRPRGASAAAASQPSAAAAVLVEPKWPAAWPYKKSDLERYDDSADTNFYSSPRFVTHIDDAAIGALTKYYASVFPPSGGADVAVLDVCSSWVSHYPPGWTAGRVAGLGMNEAELARNKALTEFVVRDLNADPALPFADNSFDVVTNCVSVDYLTQPLEVMKEVGRVLKPGGVGIMSFSNRCFPTKAVSIWTSTGDLDHVWIVGSYFHYAGGFEPPQAIDISPNPGRSDPMYIVFARKNVA